MPSSSVDTLYVDAHVVVACKPAGLLSVPGRGADKQDCLSTRLAAKWGDIHIAHRLDQATSGLMVFARNRAALQHLHAQFRQGTVDKVYEAIVHGKPSWTRLTIELPLMADWPNRPKQKVDHAHGKPSTTHAQVIHVDEQTHTCRVRLTPITGRTHQLRVHLQAVGHPMVGDALYGREATSSQALADGRLMLHASRLALTHPSTDELLVFESSPDF